MQVFRLVESGRPDKLIAFDELPKRLLSGVEMRSPDGLPRHWKSFIGDHEKYTPGALEKNPMTGKIEKIGEERVTAPFFFILYYTEINKDKDRWQEICSFVRKAVNLQFRLLDNIADMAIPMAVDAASELKVEPEDLEQNGAIIPIPLEYQEKTPAVLDKDGKEVRPEPPSMESAFKCPECEKPFKNEQAVRMHAYRAHQKKQEVPA